MRMQSSRARWARARCGLIQLKIRGFLRRPAAEAAQNYISLMCFLIVYFFLTIDFTRKHVARQRGFDGCDATIKKPPCNEGGV